MAYSKFYVKRKIHKYTEILKQTDGLLVFAPSLFVSFQPHEHCLIDLPKSITNLFVCSLPFRSKILRSNMAARAPTRTTVAHGSATSMVACSRRRTTPTHIRLTKNAFTSWKVKQNSLHSQVVHLSGNSSIWRTLFFKTSSDFPPPGLLSCSLTFTA